MTLERLGDVVELHRVPADLRPEDLHSRLGIFSWGRGVFQRPAVPVTELGRLRYFEVPAGALIASNIQAWEGALAITSEGDAACIASNRFLSYVPRAGASVDLRYVRHYLLSEEGFAQVKSASPGTQVRNRTLSQKAFEEIRVPLPEIDTQRRIAGVLDSFHALGEDLRARHTSVGAVLMQYVERGGAEAPLADLLEADCRAVPFEGDKVYDRAGVLNRGRGLFRQTPFVAGETKYDSGYLLQDGMVVLSRLKAFEGAVAVVSKEFDGSVISKEFPTFTPKPGVDPAYLQGLVSWPGLWDRMAQRSTGVGARRERISAGAFLDLRVPTHTPAQQARIARVVRTQAELQPLTGRRAELASALLPAARFRAFSQ